MPDKHAANNKKSNFMLNIVLIICIIVFIGAAGYLVNENLIKPYFNDRELEEVQEIVGDTGEAEEEEEIEKQNGEKTVVKVNDTVKSVRKLKETYPDIVGWIKIPNTDVHFPVVQSAPDDPEHYLYRNYKGEDTKYGSIFLDSLGSIEGDNQVLYGHSMMDGRMFRCLLGFSDIETYKKSPVIQYDTFEEAGKWKIISVFKANTYYDQGEPFNYIINGFGSDEEKMQYIYECMIRSTINTGVDVTDSDRFLLLSTCSYEFEGFRTVVLARKVREDESAEVDLTKAAAAENTLYPDVWYAEYGMDKPDWPENFRDAEAQGLTPWYKPIN